MEQLIKAWFESDARGYGLNEVIVSGIELTDQEIQILGTNTPSLSLFTQSTGDYKDIGCSVVFSLTVRTMLFVGSSLGKCDRVSEGSQLAHKIAVDLVSANMGFERVIEPATIKTINLSTPGSEEQGITLWGILWQQQITTNTDI